MPRTSNVFLLDDDPVHLSTSARILSQAGYRVQTFDQPEALLSRLSATDRGCLVLDLCMPTMGGLELQKALFRRGIVLPLIFVSGPADVSAVVAAMKQGAVDFLSKPVLPRELLAVVERALLKDAEVVSERAARDQARARWADLSPREQDVCRLTATGLLNKQIAAAFGTAVSTVQAQRARALKKLHVGSVIELVRLITQVGAGG